MINEVRKAIYRALYDGVNSNASDNPFLNLNPPIVFANEDDKDAVKSDVWIRLTVNTEHTSQTGFSSVGNRRYQTYGRVLCLIFSPVNKGMSDADSYAKWIRDLFIGKEIGGAFFEDVSINELGVDSVDSSKYAMLIDGSFNYDEKI